MSGNDRFFQPLDAIVVLSECYVCGDVDAKQPHIIQVPMKNSNLKNYYRACGLCTKLVQFFIPEIEARRDHGEKETR